MKTPLRHQVTMHDCGTTSFVNALVYLFEREEIPPEVVDYVTAVTLDRYVGPDHARGGTSGRALAFLAGWLNDYACRTGFPVRCQALVGSEVSLCDGSPLAGGLASGAVAVAGCCLKADHYVLVTGMGEGRVELFDPYYDTWPLHDPGDLPTVGVEMVGDQPFACNRRVEAWVFEEPAGTPYTLNTRCGRDAVLLWRVG